MIVSVASGKGGTGKTTVATNLAAVADGPVCYADCDVEEPNGAIFLKPDLIMTRTVSIPVPRVDETLCTFCGKCREACRFNAIAVLPDTVMVFDELCHGCGGCEIACPENAIHEELREIGIVERGKSGDIEFIHGILKIGQPMSPPLIKEVRREIPAGLVIIDAPPGTSCPVIASVQGSDFCLLVTEPTPFGLNDLKLAVEMVRAMGVPFGVAVNRAGSGDDETQHYCKDGGIPILAEIPDDRRVAELYSRGTLVSRELQHVEGIFETLLGKLIDMGMES